MDKTVFKGSAMLSPVPPVMVSCGDGENINVFTVAWTGTMCTSPPITYISVRPSRYSYGLIEKSGEFVINLVPRRLAAVCDSCGVVSGRDINKFKKYSLTPQKGVLECVPIIAECPVNIECKVSQKLSLGTHDVFIAEIVRVNVADELIDKKGAIALWKADLIAYAHGSYYTLGSHIGKFGFSVQKKKKNRRRPR